MPAVIVATSSPIQFLSLAASQWCYITSASSTFLIMSDFGICGK